MKLECYGIEIKIGGDIVNYFLYADDLASLVESEEHLQILLNPVSHCCGDDDMHINKDKQKLFIFVYRDMVEIFSVKFVLLIVIHTWVW